MPESEVSPINNVEIEKDFKETKDKIKTSILIFNT